MAAAPKLAREPVACARPGSRNTFVPKHGRHRFCSNTCKGRCQNYRFALKLTAPR